MNKPPELGLASSGVVLSGVALSGIVLSGVVLSGVALMFAGAYVCGTASLAQQTPETETAHANAPLLFEFVQGLPRCAVVIANADRNSVRSQPNTMANRTC